MHDVVDNLIATFSRGNLHRQIAIHLARQESLPHTIQMNKLKGEIPGSAARYANSAIKHFMEAGLGTYFKKKEGGSTAELLDPDQALQQIRAALSTMGVPFGIVEERHSTMAERTSDEPDAYEMARLAAAKELRVRPERIEIRFR